MSKNDFLSGFIAIVGRPNVGKSTLMNKLIGEKIAIISSKPQTTRNRITCVLNGDDWQMIFIDTPGIHKPRNKLGDFMVKSAGTALDEVDVVLFLTDAAAGIGGGDMFVAKMAAKAKAPVIAAVNKMDIAGEKNTLNALDKVSNLGEFDHQIAISALTSRNLDELVELLKSYLKPGPKYYPDDYITDQPERVIIAEMIREKVLLNMEQEIPHGVGVGIDAISERKGGGLMDIRATIFCERKSHKGMIIGKGGSMLKRIGTLARGDIEKLLGVQVFLELWVKVKDDWRNNTRMLNELGYK